MAGAYATMIRGRNFFQNEIAMIFMWEVER